jgi:lysophospholipase L1-like esterase
MHFASGQSFFSGLLLLSFTVVLSRLCGNRWAAMLRNVLAVVGVLLVLLSSTPLWLPLYFVLCITAGIWIIIENTRQLRRYRVRARMVIFLVAVLSAGSELPWIFTPTITGKPAAEMIVVGDSISAGLGRKITPWPKVFAETYRIPVTNLSQVGATAADAVKQAGQIHDDAALVLVEIGGNDLLMGSTVQEYASGLNKVLAKVCSPGRSVIMLELPLPPFEADFGRVQRQLASKYHVALIPKRLFASVLASPGATEDGLHLSADGAKRMAAMIHEIVANNLRP